MVDGNTKPSNISRAPHKLPNLSTHTPQEVDPPDIATPPLPKVETSNAMDTAQLPQEASPNLRLPSTKVLSQSPSKPTNPSSNYITVVSSTQLPAEPASITPLLPSVMEPKVDKTTTSSETHGPPTGETKDTSRLLPLTEP